MQKKTPAPNDVSTRRPLVPPTVPGPTSDRRGFCRRALQKRRCGWRVGLSMRRAEGFCGRLQAKAGRLLTYVMGVPPGPPMQTFVQEGHSLWPAGLVSVNTAGRRPQTGQYSGPRRVACRGSTISIRKKHSPHSQTLNAWSSNRSVLIQDLYPIIQVVQCDKQHISSLGSLAASQPNWQSKAHGC